jgi:hypothetical protein
MPSEIYLRSTESTNDKVTLTSHTPTPILSLSLTGLTKASRDAYGRTTLVFRLHGNGAGARRSLELVLTREDLLELKLLCERAILQDWLAGDDWADK